jgi:hypothetical protein
MEAMEQLEVERVVLEIALAELAGAENVGYAGLPWNTVHKAFKKLGMEVEPAAMEPFRRKVMAEGKRWQKVALQKLWGILGISVPYRLPAYSKAQDPHDGWRKKRKGVK